MTTVLNYTPGQQATIYFQLVDANGVRTNDGYVPVVVQIITPHPCNEPHCAPHHDYRPHHHPRPCRTLTFPINMTIIDTGLYYFQYNIPSGAASVGSYLIDIAYLAADGYINNEVYQLVVTAPFGNFGLTPGHLGGPHHDDRYRPFPHPEPPHHPEYPEHDPEHHDHHPEHNPEYYEHQSRFDLPHQRGFYRGGKGPSKHVVK
jgi:hypothetical protein